MSAYHHILVGLDLSEDSTRILKKASVIAASLNAKITVAHILEPLAFAYGGDMPIDLSEAQNVMEQQATLRLKKLCEENDLSSAAQIVSLGQAAHELHTLAEQNNADLIVVGSHEKHGLAILTGSTAKGVVSHAKCDVLTLRV